MKTLIFSIALALASFDLNAQEYQSFDDYLQHSYQHQAPHVVPHVKPHMHSNPHPDAFAYPLYQRQQMWPNYGYGYSTGNQMYDMGRQIFNAYSY